MALNSVGAHLGDKVFVLQVGVGNGLTGVPLLPRFRDDGWSGLMIEPHPALFRALADLHADSDRVAVLNLGVASQEGTQALHHLTEAATARFPGEFAEKATVDLPRLQRAMAAAQPAALAEDATQTDVPMLRLDTVLRELGIDSVDLLVVNAGGHERDVVQSCDLAALNMTAVLIDRTGTNAPDDAAIIAVVQAAGLEVFRIGHRLLAIKPEVLNLRLDDILIFFGTAVGREAVA